MQVISKALRLTILAVLFTIPARQGMALTLNYDFDDLSTGLISGQDGWSTVDTGVNGGVNPSIAENDTAGDLYLYPARGGGHTHTNLWRAADLPFSATDTAAFIEADLDSWWGVSLWVGRDLGDGSWETGPMVTMRPENRTISVLNGAGGLTKISYGDYELPRALRLRMDMDFTANSGAGSYSISLMDMTGGSWLALGENYNLGLGMNSNTILGPGDWNGFGLGFESNPGLVDNLVFSNGAAPEPVPEPATLLLFGTGIAGVAVSRFRRGKR